MIDLHTHSLLSDGELLPSELARRALVNGYKAIAITDHVDESNIEPVITGLVKVSRTLNKYWDILVLPGVEITHVPVEVIPELTSFARGHGARIVVGHGESPVEPVLSGTNSAAIKAGIDILAHPGEISEEDVKLALDRGVYLEITARKGHSEANKHVFDLAQKVGAKLVLNTDSHSPDDLLTPEKRDQILSSFTSSDEIKRNIIQNSEDIINKLTK